MLSVRSFTSSPGERTHDRRPSARATSSPAIEASGLTKRFGSILALDDLDLVVPSGSIFGLLGPNGAGKTTTIRILTGLARPTAGRASVAGIEVDLDQPELRRRLGYLDQDPRFYPWMTGRELLDLVGRLHGLSGSTLRSRVAELLARTGLSAAAERRIGGYSGGMRQRLGIAQALLHRPQLLFLDEPVSSLDPEGRRDLLELIAGLREEATVVFSTHVLSDVERVCDRVAILDRGRLVIEGPLAALLAAHARPIFRLVPAPGQDEAAAILVDRLRAESWATDVVVDGVTVRVSVSDPEAAGSGVMALAVATGVVLDLFERFARRSRMSSSNSSVQRYQRIWMAVDSSGRARCRTDDRARHPAPQGTARAMAHGAPAHRRGRLPARRALLPAARAIRRRNSSGPSAETSFRSSSRPRPPRMPSTNWPRTSASSERSLPSSWRWARSRRRRSAAPPRSS